MDPLDSTFRMLVVSSVGERQYDVPHGTRATPQDSKSLRDIIAVLDMDELREEDEITVVRAHKLQRFFLPR